MMIKIKSIFFFALLILGLANCGASTPSESDARAIFEKKYGQDIKDGVVKVIKFKKIDGQSSELAGVRFYTLQYEAEIEYPNGAHSECEHPVGFQPSCGFYYSFKEIGEREKLDGKLVFEKTENGWQVSN